MRLPKETWEEIRIKFETDSTVNCVSLAKQYGVTRQAVDGRMRKEGWKKANKNVAKLAEQFVVTEISGKATPENLAQFLNCMALFRNEKLACDVIGVDPKTVWRWKEKDAQFARAVGVARARKVTTWLECIDRAAQNDYKAALELLKRAPETRDTFGESRDAGTKIVFNIVRDRALVNP